MNSLLTEYILKIESLENYISQTQKIEKSLLEGRDSPEFSSDLISFFRASWKKKYDYNLIIITLYGILESYIEECVVEYLKKMTSYTSIYNDLPEKIKNLHISLSAELIKYIDKKYDKYSDIKKEDVIVRLSGCIQNDANYKMNTAAFTHHTSNFRQDAIRDFFSHIGFENITTGITKHSKFKEYYLAYEGVDEEEFNQHTLEGFYGKLQDLVMRRNLIAHGTETDDLLSLDLLSTYTKYIKAIILSIHGIIDDSLKRVRFSKSPKLNLGRCENVFQHSIVAVYSNHHKIKVGMDIWATTQNGDFVHSGKILSIEENRVATESISEDNDSLICIKVDFHAKDNYIYGIYQ